jgi:glycolate oxidase FAD binding subunit
VARSGGKVVKNVAGYDLGKLFVGSYGTLGVIASCTFRLHPLPRDEHVVSVVTRDPDDIVRTVRRSPLRPNAVEYDGERLHVAIDGSPSRVVDLVGGDVNDALPVGRPWRPGEAALKVTHRVGALGRVVADVRDAAPDLRMSAHAASGVMWLGGHVEPQQVETLRARVAACDGTVVVVDGPDALKQAVDVWGPVRGLPVMRAVKEQFDPLGRMNRGRFAGGI